MTARFIETLLAADHPVIMEVKRRDSHGRDLFRGRSVAQIVADFEAAGAPCVSVVTGPWFGGSTTLLREVAAITDRPVLQKDFITRRDQVREAADLGASAVLVTAALLTPAILRDLVAACLDSGLTPFVEVTSEEEIEAVPHSADCVIAVNNKDIMAKERDPGDLARSVRLLPALLRTGTRCPVSASGIDRPEVAARLLDHGFAGLLIGTSLLRAGSARHWIDELGRSRMAPAGRP